MHLPAPNSNKSDAQQILQCLFTAHPVAGVFLANPWVPVLLAHSQNTGVVLNCADTVTSVALIVDLQLIHEAVTVLPVGANDMTPAGLDCILQARSKHKLETCNLIYGAV